MNLAARPPAPPATPHTPHAAASDVEATCNGRRQMRVAIAVKSVPISRPCEDQGQGRAGEGKGWWGWTAPPAPHRIH